MDVNASAPDDRDDDDIDLGSDADADLPPSARYVVYVLEDAGGTAGRDELLDRTGLPERTVDEALARLEAEAVVRRDRASDDLRFVHVELAEKS
ncbi:MarR family transcriptional regulator [Salinilacihabitans rarus]|uniref:MarR family transcriptional regulator n=1 Tax=Salinilacihabitans rarus TaxID=2961596 RepID=UPI0020C8BAFD|nr:MarR family transcriptional regulator [Salinilacihabitans rarus]